MEIHHVSPSHFGPEAWEWIAAHAGEDLGALRLKYGRTQPYHSWIVQLEARAKYSKKFPALLERRWIFAGGVSLEQSSSEATAQFKAGLIDAPFTVDLTGGGGVDSWALQSRAVSKGHFVCEPSPQLAELIQHNLPGAVVFHGTAEQALEGPLQAWLKQVGAHPEEVAIYLDPDRRPDGKRRVGLEQTTPPLLKIQEKALELAQTVWSKHSPLIDLGEAHELRGVERVMAVEYRGECKEVLFVQRAGFEGDFERLVVEVDSGAQLKHRGDLPSLETAENWSGFLIQPGAGLAKLAMHPLLGQQQHWRATPYGNLCTSVAQPELSPLYRVFKVVEVASPYKLGQLPTHAAIECIGFPERVEVVRKKLRVKEGREWKIFALKNRHTKVMILAQLIE